LTLVFVPSVTVLVAAGTQSVRVLAQLAAGEVIARAGDRAGRPFGAGTPADARVRAARALTAARVTVHSTLGTADAGVEDLVVDEETGSVERVVAGQRRARLGVADFLLHQHATLEGCGS
jgi:hypothetical protein